VFLGLAVAVVAMEVGWFTPLGLSYQDFLFNLNPTILTPVRGILIKIATQQHIPSIS